MSSAGINRKILRAFYSQYVAVLLIILVLSVGTVHNSLAARTSVITMPADRIKSPVIGTFMLLSTQPSDTAEQLQERQDLTALIEILRNHDLRADIAVPTTENGELRANIMAAIARAQAIKRILLNAGVPMDAVRLSVSQQQQPNSGVTVSFRNMRERDEHF